MAFGPGNQRNHRIFDGSWRGGLDGSNLRGLLDFKFAPAPIPIPLSMNQREFRQSAC